MRRRPVMGLALLGLASVAPSCSTSPATRSTASTVQITHGTGAAGNLTATTDCKPVPTALGRSLPWMPAALSLPPGSYPSKEFTPPDASEHAASFVVPMVISPFVQYVVNNWPGHGVTIGHAEEDPNDSEFTFLYRGAEGSFSIVHDLCGGGSLLVVAYGNALSGANH